MSAGAPRVAVIGGGPAGLMAAEAAVAHGASVAVYDAMPSNGRKFLIAGKGGLNLTHRESGPALLARYTDHAVDLAAALAAFDSRAVRAWAAGLGIATFIGSSGRVFPEDMKAAPLLRRWLTRLRAAGVEFYSRHRWCGFDTNLDLRFETPHGTANVHADATVLALGGGSWPQLGSDGAWAAILAAHGVDMRPLRAANCGFECTWSTFLRERYAGSAVKAVALTLATRDGAAVHRQGEFILTDYGLEGALVYTLSALISDQIERSNSAEVLLDLAPDRALADLERGLGQARGSHTLAHQLKRRAGISGVKSALLHELTDADLRADSVRLARAIKALPLRLHAARPIAEAISSAGGVCFSALDADYMLRRLPGVFVAGEMLDWDAPTGGYLLTACLATGRAAGAGAAQWGHSHIDNENHSH